MLELVYGTGRNIDHDVITKPLADGDIETVHFKTPALANHGSGGWCGFANDGNDQSEIVLSLTTDPTAFKGATVGQLSGSIRFVAKIPALQNVDRYVQLQSSTDYYIRIQSLGPSGRGVTVKLYAAKEPKEGEQS
jgi:hypothetical protein